MCKIGVIFACMNAQTPKQTDPADEIIAVLRDFYERGMPMRAAERLLGFDHRRVKNFAAVNNWQAPAALKCNLVKTDVFDDASYVTDGHPAIAIKRCCKQLVASGWTAAQIQKKTGLLQRVIWALTGTRVAKVLAVQKILGTEDKLKKKLDALLEKEDPTERDYLGIEKLTAALYHYRRCQIVEATGLIQPGKEALKKLNDTPAAKQAHTNDTRNKAKRKANDISHVTIDLLDEIRESMLFLYQKLWFGNKAQRTRFVLKSRQVGATFYFAWEALDDAIRTGDDQIFISASRDQAQVFREYITAFAREKFEVELKGKFCIELSNGAKLRFLATNTATAQSYHGHLYIDEVFWIPKFKALKKVADGMAAHKKWRKTYFSTPSAMSHDAFPLWSGSDYAANHKISDFEIDTSHEALKGGLVGPDKIWRHLLTVVDADAQGCDLFDIDELKGEYSENDFANQFLCKFIDDSQSVFKLQDLMNCVIEGDSWPDYKPNIERPFANRAAAFGFDPSRTRDNASLAILEIPANYTKPFRVLNLHSFHGQNVQRQASQIKELVDTHTVRHLGIDTTGIGSGVFDLVRDYYPLAVPIHYSPAMKNTLVIKVLDLIANGRFKYLSSQHEITRAFMMITQTTSPSGQIVYASSRSPNAGHADVAWAIMHACLAEEINVNRKQTKVTFSD